MAAIRPSQPCRGRKGVRVAVVAQTTGVADERERARLALGEGDHVMRLVRVRSDGTRVLSYETAVLPMRRFPGLGFAENATTRDIWDLAREYGLSLGRAVENLQRGAASEEVAGHIGVRVGTPVLVLDRVIADTDGVPVEWRIAFAAR